MTPILPALSDEIERGSDVVVTYRMRTGEKRTYTLPLKGLKEAVAAITTVH